jgi:hypothetical protein
MEEIKNEEKTFSSSNDRDAGDSSHPGNTDRNKR